MLNLHVQGKQVFKNEVKLQRTISYSDGTIYLFSN